MPHVSAPLSCLPVCGAWIFDIGALIDFAVTQQVMLPPPAAAAVDAMDIKKALAILMAMDPAKAADLLAGGSGL
jgi:hypothetical protein